MRARTVAALAALVAAVAFVPALGAFASSDVAPRSVLAAVVDDATAYHSVTGGSCPGVPLEGGTCAFTLTNRAPAAHAYAAAVASDPAGAVTGFSFTPSGAISTGASTTLAADVAACGGCAGQTREVLWTIEASREGEMRFRLTDLRMTITYEG